ncbi:glycosyltransferase [Flagellimonas sp. DF-77]|uniref:glycosyltransferase n=1 Tax=Flagellimonas algarum TaxID=3230298 RepID=UPI003393637F
MAVFFVDPMGYGNLAAYDTALLSHVSTPDITYFTSTNYDLGLPHRTLKWYSYSNKKGIAKIISYLGTQFRLWKTIRRNRPELIHFQWVKIPKIDHWLLRRIKGKGIPIVLTAHNLLPHDSGDRYRKSYAKIYALVDAIIVHTETTKKELVSEFRIQSGKIHVIPHGILGNDRSDANAVVEKKRSLIDSWGLKDKVVFSVLGNINKYKGVNETIEAWLSLDKDLQAQATLIIAGNGQLQALERVRDRNDVILINRFLGDDEFSALIQLSDYILLPYLKISQSGVLLTVLHEKKKVIVSDRGGLAEPFQFGNIGQVLETVAPESIKTAIIKAISEADVQPSEMIWSRIHEHYDWQGIGKKTQELYSKLVTVA